MMRKIVKVNILIILVLFLVNCSNINSENSEAKNVITRIVGEKNAELFDLKIEKNSELNDSYSVSVKNGKIQVVGNSPVALCRGAYDYLSNGCNSIVSWSGNRINIPAQLPDYSNTITSPYQYRYYFNVVTHGYTTPFWDWNRWEKEIDWMAVHGINMPLLSGAHEAILFRVFKKLGLTNEEIDTYFTGPAHLPWNKMGNITGWDGPLPDSYFEKQIILNHKILKRLEKLGMSPIVPAFAGFVPKAITRLFPEEKLRQLAWGGFADQYKANILEPGSDLFIKIGKMYITEYEKEFGKMEYYLADSFNEMDVPLSDDPAKAEKELAGYGKAVYSSINEANPEATWVMQGWTFPYQKGKDGKLFWTPNRLKALLSEIPDNKLLILDLANEYNRLWWKSEPSWKLYDGFFGKKWIYSFIPNMGGKVPLNGNLDIYATIPIEALNYDRKQNLVGFGFAPEGIENNEIIYELLSDMGWTDKEIELKNWIESYCKKRYGSYPNKMKKAYEYLNKSCFDSFTPHPRFKYQLRPNSGSDGTVHISEDFNIGVKTFLECSDEMVGNKLYEYDAIELGTQYLGIKTDELLKKFTSNKGSKNYKVLDEALELMAIIDKLLESHPNHKLENWQKLARNFGDTETEKKYYESNANRLITTWGGRINDYSARTWSGLIRDYYLPRWKLYYEAEKNGQEFDLQKWEEDWIKTSKLSSVEPYPNPINQIKLLINRYQ